MSFSKTSKDITLDNNMLKASCKRFQGDESVSSAFDLDSCIGNQGGVIWWGSGDFHWTARNISLRWFRDRPYLDCELQDWGGDWCPATLNLDERIQNNDGVLEYD